MRKSTNIVLGVLGVIGRILLCTVFLAAAVGYTAPDVHRFAKTIAQKTWGQCFSSSPMGQAG